MKKEADEKRVRKNRYLTSGRKLKVEIEEEIKLKINK